MYIEKNIIKLLDIFKKRCIFAENCPSMRFCLRIILMIFVFWLPCAAEAQVVEDFSDGNFTENPSWLGADSCFKVNANGQLQSDASEAGTAFLSVPFSACQSMEWRFWIRENFSPSKNNYSDVYLVADTFALESVGHGYFLRFGAAGSLDAIELYRKDASGEQLLCQGSEGHIAAPFKMGVKVLCDAAGHWSVYTDDECLGMYAIEAEGDDNAYPREGFFGFLLQYTSSNAKKFYFDDIYVGPEVIDTIPPNLINIETLDDRHLLLCFDEPLGPSALVPEHYSVEPGVGAPDSVAFGDRPSIVILTFSLPFQENFSYTINLTGVGDLSHNMIGINNSFWFIHPSEEDVVINEVMADPSPVVGLPEWEYLELFNTQDFPIDLKDWILTIGTTSRQFSSVIIEPMGYLIVCKDDAVPELSFYGNTFSFPSLAIANAGATLRLFSPDETLISEVAFNDTWYHDASKKDGGWSLEQIDPFNPCAGTRNWSASIDPSGGTPGRVNSINAPNAAFPSVQHSSMLGDNILFLWFDQQMDRASLSEASHYYVKELGLYPSEVVVNPNDASNVELIFGFHFEEGVLYTLIINDVATCSGIMIEPDTPTGFGVPNMVGKGEVLLNEILFDPVSPGVDYVELYNCSDKTFDLMELKLGAIKEHFPNPADTTLKEISGQSRLFLPHTYLLLSTDGLLVAGQYECVPDDYIDMPAFPSFPNAGGVALLVSRDGVVVDQMAYDVSMHYPLLRETKGVSLERVSWDLPSLQPDNWHSAAEAVHFGTPGYANSMAQVRPEPQGEVSVAPEVFSPDGDGLDDHSVVSYTLEKAGCTLNVYVFSADGRLVRQLVKGELAGQEGGFAWNGLDEKGNRVPLGLYVVVTEVLDLQGDVKRYKNAVAVASR